MPWYRLRPTLWSALFWLLLAPYGAYQICLRWQLLSGMQSRVKSGASEGSDEDANTSSTLQNLPHSSQIVTVLENAAKTTRSMVYYPAGSTLRPDRITYAQFYLEAQESAGRLRALPDWKRGRICLVRLDSHVENILWFWAIILAGGIPAMCPPFTPEDAQAKLRHLSKILSNPLCLTTPSRFGLDLNEFPKLRVYTIEELQTTNIKSLPSDRGFFSKSETSSSIAVIMLTSGSSGKPKAVPLSYNQIRSALDGKSSQLPGHADATILNWVSMDHVAGLVEAHIRALAHCVDQVHVTAADIMSNPSYFLTLLDYHKVSASFAPNFLLAEIVDGVDNGRLIVPETLDLSHLHAIASGGEACATDVCRRVTRLLQRFGAPGNVIKPGFGMTETCAGCIFNPDCPDVDLNQGHALASVGKCVPGVEMRITSIEDVASKSTIRVNDANVTGHLELRGPILFSGYLCDGEIMRSDFTADGWFKTGDMGFIDTLGNLVLTGRSKDVICINGVNHLAVDQERVIENAHIPGVAPNHVICFARRMPGTSTEQCCIVYQHAYAAHEVEARALAQAQITKLILLNIGTRPFILPLAPSVLQRSTLGKFSRSSISSRLANGEFETEIAYNSAAMSSWRSAQIVEPTNAAERVMLDLVQSTLHMEPGELGIDTAFFDAGITSVNLMRLSSQICQKFNLPTMSIRTLIMHDTVRSLTKAISELPPTQSTRYDPVVELRESGSKTPLWLIHPGVGEVLVFLGLAQRIQDRPVYALRARGFEEGESVFTSIDETVDTYMEAIRSRQPLGPYAIAGYSYGSMLAFEISKKFEAQGEKIGFLGCFNLPPHIKSRMQQLSLQHCLIHLALFLQLIDDAQTSTLEVEATDLPIEPALDLILSRSSQARWQELDLTRDRVLRWAHVAFSLQSRAVDYEPAGAVEHIDVFYCEPLSFAARSKEEWLERHLSKWKDFSRTAPRFHPVDGAHYTMLSPENVRSFHKTLEEVLYSRSLS